METDTNLEIRTDVLEKQPETTTSLCDRFGINMYSQDFLEKEEVYNQEQEKRQNDILCRVMSNEKTDTNEESFQTVLNAQTEAVLKKDYAGEQKDTSAAISYLYLLLGIVLAGAVLYYIEQKRRSRKKREDYSDNYQLRDEPEL